MKNCLYAILLVFVLNAGLFRAQASETTYFLSGTHFNGLAGETYVVPLKDPEHIAHARKLIEGFEGGELETASILVADIKLGHANVNVDYSKNPVVGHRWHVANVVGFGEVATEIGDGAPWLINEAIDGRNSNSWIDFESGLGRISFWGFTIIAELPFPATRVDKDGGKRTWIGVIKDFTYPWIQHEELGWIYPVKNHEDGYWIWIQNEQTWVFTNKSLYPHLYSAKDGSWVFHHEGGSLDYWWHIFSTGEWRQNSPTEAFYNYFATPPPGF